MKSSQSPHVRRRTIHAYILTSITVMALGLAILLAGCVPVGFQHPRLTRSLEVSEPPDVAWLRVVQTTMNMGGMIWQQDPQQHWLQAYVDAKPGCSPPSATSMNLVAMSGLTGTGQASLNVRVTPHGSGSRLDVSHQVSETYLPGGSDGTLSEDFLTCYAQR